MAKFLAGLSIGLVIGLAIGYSLPPRSFGRGSQVHHVLIAYPEHWSIGERRACFLGPAGGTTVDRAYMGQADLPQLDCDRFVQGELIHKAAPERIFALDIVFLGDLQSAIESKRNQILNETPCACERIGNEKIECKP